MRYSTEKADLRMQWKSIVPKALALALIITLQTFLSFDTIKVTPYRPAEAQEEISIQDIPETEQQEPDIPEMERPANIEIEEAVDEDVTEDVVVASTELVEHVDHIDIVAPIDRDPAPDEFVAYDTPPRPVHTVAAVYPQMALASGMEGTVYVKILVDERGNPKRAIIVKGLGMGFDEAAISAAMQCRFTPAMQRDKPVRVWISVPFKFTIHR
jgi:TonB family protein